MQEGYALHTLKVTQRYKKPTAFDSIWATMHMADSHAKQEWKATGDNQTGVHNKVDTNFAAKCSRKYRVRKDYETYAMSST